MPSHVIEVSICFKLGWPEYQFTGLEYLPVILHKYFFVLDIT